MRALPPLGDRSHRRVGLLGGSFNPAHEGHVHLSREAMKRLGLDAVWWLVSPQNPLKPSRGMAPLAKRLAHATDVASKEPTIVVTDVERRFHTQRTRATLGHLQQRYPSTAFVWLMGADNLAQMPNWWRWPEIFKTVRVAVFDRSPYSYRALAGAAAHRFAGARRAPQQLWCASLPGWCWVPIRRHPASATALRAGATN